MKKINEMELTMVNGGEVCCDSVKFPPRSVDRPPVEADIRPPYEASEVNRRH